MSTPPLKQGDKQKKVLIINTSKGVYSLPLILIAEDRAKYYAEKDGYVKDSREWKVEVDFVMEDDFEGIDWLLNNTNWEDWQDKAEKLNNEVNVTDEDFWNLTKSFNCSRTHTNKDGSVDVGIFQINSIHTKTLAKKGMTMEDMKDCKKNIDFAYSWVYEGSGWGAWSAYNNKSYLTHSEEI